MTPDVTLRLADDGGVSVFSNCQGALWFSGRMAAFWDCGGVAPSELAAPVAFGPLGSWHVTVEGVAFHAVITDKRVMFDRMGWDARAVFADGF